MPSLRQRLERMPGGGPSAGGAAAGHADDESLIGLAERLVADAQSHAESARRLAHEADSQVRSSERRGAGPGGPDGAAPATVARASDELAAGAQKLAQAAFALDLKVKFARSTNTFRAWQQVPAWGLALAGLGLAFYLASRGEDFDSVGAWITVMLTLVLAVITMFRGPADLSLGTGGGAAPRPAGGGGGGGAGGGGAGGGATGGGGGAPAGAGVGGAPAGAGVGGAPAGGQVRPDSPDNPGAGPAPTGEERRRGEVLPPPPGSPAPPVSGFRRREDDPSV